MKVAIVIKSAPIRWRKLPVYFSSASHLWPSLLTSLKRFFKWVGVVNSEAGVGTTCETAGILIETNKEQLIRLTFR